MYIETPYTLILSPKERKNKTHPGSIDNHPKGRTLLSFKGSRSNHRPRRTFNIRTISPSVNMGWMGVLSGSCEWVIFANLLLTQLINLHTQPFFSTCTQTHVIRKKKKKRNEKERGFMKERKKERKKVKKRDSIKKKEKNERKKKKEKKK